MTASQHSAYLPIYRRSNITMVRGEDVWLFDDKGTAYLDFSSGIATNALGHGHKAVKKALMQQADQLWHCSNLFDNLPLRQFATALTCACFADKVFFCSSGSEAVEAAIKTMRRYHYVRGDAHRTEIIAMQGAFHGRTTGALAACSNTRSQEGFSPLMAGFHHAPFQDSVALEQMITERTAGIMLEPVQGEGGVRAHSIAYLQEVRRLCDAHGILLFLDEIQCGYGRTGALFDYMHAGITPDILTCAKGIGNGFPLGAMLCTDAAGQGMTQGTHGSTYGSNPLACSVGLAVLNVMQQEGFFAHVQEMGELLIQHLKWLVDAFPALFTEVRGRGLMLGLGMQSYVDKYALSGMIREQGLLVCPAVTDAMRILPPLIVQADHIKLAYDKLHKGCKDYMRSVA
jgi:acetylornithine/N-succinyldiaminopimelate aminotransferase